MRRKVKGIIRGGSWETFWTHNKHKTRRWPQDATLPDPGDPRPVTISITSWVGVSIGARHTMLDMEEEENPVWDDHEDSWRHIWDDSESKGRTINANVMDATEALHIAAVAIITFKWYLPAYRVEIQASDSEARALRHLIMQERERAGLAATPPK